jgi:hypothetical protein
MLMLWVPESVDKAAASSHLPLLLTHLRTLVSHNGNLDNIFYQVTPGSFCGLGYFGWAFAVGDVLRDASGMENHGRVKVAGDSTGQDTIVYSSGTGPGPRILVQSVPVPLE